MSENVITIYGTLWCGDCFRVRKFFEKNHIPYKWVDIDRDEQAEEFVFSINRGMRSVPTIVFEDGSIMVEPSNFQLTQLLNTLLPSL